MLEAIITGAVAIIVCMLNNLYQNKAVRSQHDKTIALIDYKLEQLTQRVDKHNSVVERVYHLEERTEVQEERIKVANHRIDDLEKEKEK